MLTGVGATFTYDEANRVQSATEVSGGTEYFGYAPDNKLVYRNTASGQEEEFFYLTYAHDQPPERQSRSAEAVGG
jgi:hypothetical protein